ncbi:hypothetical protein ACPVPU_07320 [Sphingomonas sp. CJ99]
MASSHLLALEQCAILAANLSKSPEKEIHLLLGGEGVHIIGRARRPGIHQIMSEFTFLIGWQQLIDGTVEPAEAINVIDRKLGVFLEPVDPPTEQ